MNGQIVIKVTKGEFAGHKREFICTRNKTILAGRGNECHIRFKDEGVSRLHCEIIVDFPSVTMRDLDSTNGTWLNGKNIGQNQSCTLASFNRIGLGLYSEIAIEIVETVKCRCLICHAQMECTCGQINICPDCETNRTDEVALAKNIIANLAYCAPEVITDDEPPIPNCLIPGYREISFIRKGSMGQVYLVEDTRNRLMALKLMHSKTESDEQHRLFFAREMLLMQHLEHTNLVKLHDSGKDGDRFFIVMEYCCGGDVNELQHNSSGGKLPLHLATSILLQTLDGLDYIHNAENVTVILKNGIEKQTTGVVHRDIKPSNLLISNSNTSQPEIKIADLGLAKTFETAGQTIETEYKKGVRVIKGTKSFMSYQQFLNSRGAPPAVDVWSAAATYYYMLTGHYVREVPNEETIKAWNEMYLLPPIPIRSRLSDIPEKPDIPENLANVIDETLANDDINGTGIAEMTAKYGSGINRSHQEALALKKAVWESLTPDQQDDVLRILPDFTRKTLEKGL
jgi:serine/threonine protein kinase